MGSGHVKFRQELKFDWNRAHVKTFYISVFEDWRKTFKVSWSGFLSSLWGLWVMESWCCCGCLMISFREFPKYLSSGQELVLWVFAERLRPHRVSCLLEEAVSCLDVSKYFCPFLPKWFLNDCESSEQEVHAAGSVFSWCPFCGTFVSGLLMNG